MSTVITMDQYYRANRMLQSAINRTNLTFAVGNVLVTLGRRCSPYVTHKTALFNVCGDPVPPGWIWINDDSTIGTGIGIPTGGNTLAGTMPSFLGDAGHLVEYTVHMPRRPVALVCEWLQNELPMMIEFGQLPAIVPVVVNARKLSHFDDEGRPVYVPHDLIAVATA